MFVSFKRDAERQIKIDINKVSAYEPSAKRDLPAEEYTAIFFDAGIIYVNEPFEEVDKKMAGAGI